MTRITTIVTLSILLVMAIPVGVHAGPIPDIGSFGHFRARAGPHWTAGDHRSSTETLRTFPLR